MKQKLKKQEIGFSQIKNEVANDGRLSFKARGIFLYLYSKPDDWDFSVDRIVKANKTDKKASVMAGLKELESLGYLERKRLSTGKMEYHIRFEPLSENRTEGTELLSENPTVGKSHSGKIGQISNKENNTNTEEESNTGEAPASQDIAAIIELFAEINPAITYGNRTQREAAKNLIVLWKGDVERTVEAVKQVISIQSVPYAPLANTPLRMLNKISDIKIFLDRERAKQQGKGVLRV